MFGAPRFRDERGGCGPLAAHAQTEQKTKEGELWDRMGKAAGGAGERIDEDGCHERASASDAVRENTEKKSTDGGSDERQRTQKARGARVHAELEDEVGENERVEHHVHGVEHPAEAAGGERFAFGGSDVAWPPESPRGAGARKTW